MKSNFMGWSRRAAICFAALGTCAYADQLPSVDQELQDFYANSAEYMQRQIPKTDINGEIVKIDPIFSQESIESREFVLQKDHIQKTSPLYHPEGRAPFYNNDVASNLVDQFQYNSLEAMERGGVTQAQLGTMPWSDDYWPIYTGGVAKRYADPNFPNSKHYALNKNYILRSLGGGCSVEQLSPAEKYDLLVGDRNKTLTQVSANGGMQYGGGDVETWMGHCHGWAPASYMYGRPAKAVDLLAADGRTWIRFFPSDIKALGSVLWANLSPPTRFISGRCGVKNPRTDASGRIQDQGCFDTNPATWHMAVVNQIGVSKRSFVMDATYDYEVWNQPVYGYQYSYFNPQTMQEVGRLSDARVPVNRFSRDKFSRYRSRQAAYVVGIAMKTGYVVETEPSHNTVDSAQADGHKVVRYLYDLELDSSGRIIGGEWYQNTHPDFLWTPSPSTHAMTQFDRGLPGWNGSSRMPDSWQRAAQGASRYGQPLGHVVDALFALSAAGMPR